jgi:hypothetical protein
MKREYKSHSIPCKIIFELVVKGKVKTQSRFWRWNVLFALDDSKKGGRRIQMEWWAKKKKTKRRGCE